MCYRTQDMAFRMKHFSAIIIVLGGLLCLLTILRMEKRFEVIRDIEKQQYEFDLDMNIQRYSNKTEGKLKLLLGKSRKVMRLPNQTSDIVPTSLSMISEGNVASSVKPTKSGLAFDRVHTFLIFIGYPRSGTTIVGSILDAHPNIVIAHEYNLGRKWLSLDNRMRTREYIFSELLANSKNQTRFGQRAKSIGQIFNYHVPGLWQGKYKKYVEVIGDKKGGATARVLHSDHGNFITELQNSLDVPVKFIHIIRNPFDNIATMAIRKLKARAKVKANPSFVIKNDEVLKAHVKQYFSLVHANSEIRERFGKRVLDVKYSRLVRNPKKVLKIICKFLKVNCSTKYLNACAKKIFVKETETRKNFNWPEALKAEVFNYISKYSFLKGFEL